MRFISLFSILFIFNININAQIKEKDSLSNKNKKEELYSNKENEYIKNWFESEIESMELSEKVKEQYYNIVMKYTDAMAKFGDNNKNLAKEDFKKGLGKIVETMNLELEPILSESQHQSHKNNFKVILWNIGLRKGWGNKM